MAPGERASISVAVTWIIMLFSASDVLCAVCVGSSDSDGKNDSPFSQDRIKKRKKRTKSLSLVPVSTLSSLPNG